MNATHTSYETTNRPLTAVLDAVPAGAWSGPSPCDGWSATDVVAHLVQTQRDFLLTHGADLGPAPDVPADPGAAWRDHAQRVLGALAHDGFVATGYDGHVGPTTVGASLE